VSTGNRGDGTTPLALVVGLVVVGMAVALGAFIQLQGHAGGPPEDAPRWIAIPALYATAGMVAIIASLQRRPLIVTGAGIVCLVGSILSVATIMFAIPGVALLALSARTVTEADRGRRDGVVAAGVVVLVIGAGVALLATTGQRCWEETGTATSPTYTVTACGDGASSTGGGRSVGGGAAAGTQVIGSGYDSGVLTTTGGLTEAALLLGALALVILTGRGAAWRKVRGHPGPGAG
jgi:hypothetical protein